MNLSAGFCLGASSVSVAVAGESGGVVKIIHAESLAHSGSPREKFTRLLEKYNLQNVPVAVTGRKFRHLARLEKISEPEATEIALQFLYGDKRFGAVASLGGETFIVYTLDSESRIANVITKNQCASGTGEFFLQQIGRMGMGVDETLEIARDAEPFRVSGRCSVFCKSDCTHALNKGVPKSEVAAGLSKMIAEKADELLSKDAKGRILLTGGVTKNTVVMDYLRAEYPDSEIAEYQDCFEAVGAAIYAREKSCPAPSDFRDIFVAEKSSFPTLKPISEFTEKVVFKDAEISPANPGEECILGLDVGSTTTKAVLISNDDRRILAKVYLYTRGNPVKAARDCYSELMKQVPGDIQILGLGTTGSGRQITGLHAQTEGVINEIVAHATAAVHFDPEVDTIFEIGGQDAKYTYIVNKVPADYAMNEACSAGTGSFIEEAALESLGIGVREIEGIAIRGMKPPNFSDQCAAFIGSDIKTALQENLSREDVTAGLVYSICMNYVNRVMGNRQVGKKIFMQGGVCYNKAIPIAMAAITGREIIVPPEPGLMGAYGVALGVKEKIDLGIMEKSNFSLAELSGREVNYKKPFTCLGGKEKCDRKCTINIIEVNGKKFPFGGACNKYYNLKNTGKFSGEDFELVKKRYRMYMQEFAFKGDLPEDAPTVGINLSFHTYNLFPLYSHFFGELGFRTIISDDIDEEGLEREATSFCYPAQQSLGTFQNLLNKNPDRLFVPSILEMRTDHEPEPRLDFNCTCVFVSGEMMYLRQAFKDKNIADKLISPNLNFAAGFEKEEEKFIEIAGKLGIKDKSFAENAYKKAIEQQVKCQESVFRMGEEFLDWLDANPDKFAMVIVGRAYNSFTGLANKGIPLKFASRGVHVVPYDIFDYRDEPVDENMFWEGGKKILKAAQIISRHPRLFATFISNFSCGPDSMIIPQFRKIMGNKPSLTLELDGHTADAGINTRIDAALDIIANYMKLRDNLNNISLNGFHPAGLDLNDKKSWFISSSGEKIPLNHPAVKILIPSMGDIGSEMFASAFRSLGFNAEAMPPGNADILKYGRANASGKECLPLLLMAGSLADYMENRRNGDRYVVFFTVQGAGNCRLGQYPVFIREMIERHRWNDVTQVTLMNEDGFAGFGNDFSMRAIQALFISDVLDDIRSAILANAENPERGLEIFDEEFQKLNKEFEQNPKDIYYALEKFAENIRMKIPARIPIEDSKYIALLGEIYVRRDGFAHKWLNRYFAARGFVVHTQHVSEWIQYVDYLLKIDLLEADKSIKKKLEQQVRVFFMTKAEKKNQENPCKIGLLRISQNQNKTDTRPQQAPDSA
jgi:predicted CoA-substrate-specific enzyme activase